MSKKEREICEFQSVWVWIITFFGLKSGQDLKNWAARPHQEFPGDPPPLGITLETYSTYNPGNKGASYRSS